MRHLRRLCRKVYFAFHRDRLERELAEEMAAHRDMMGDGRRHKFGNVMRLREDSSAVWSWSFMEQTLQDLTYGLRTLRKSPGFTAGAVAVLALGIGVNLAEFQIFDAMIFHRIHLREVNAILEFSHLARKEARFGFVPGAVEFYRKESRLFSWLISEDSTLKVVVEGDADVDTRLVSGDYFTRLGVVPLWGRMLESRDAERLTALTAVLGYEYWRTRWAGDPGVVGRTIRVNNQPVRIVGVMPPGFAGFTGRSNGLWMPLAVRPRLVSADLPAEVDFQRVSQTLFGKLKPGYSMASGTAELTALSRELARQHPRAFADDDRIQGAPVQKSMSLILRSPPIAIFIVMIFLVLFSACANLGNMLLARGMVREREIAIRLAIGASRSRVVRQLMTENMLLAFAGSLAGLLFGAGAGSILMKWMGAPPDLTLRISLPLFLAGVSIAFASAILFGLPSALQIVKPVRAKIRLRQGLVGVQIAVSCLLLIASALLARNGIAAASQEVAFDYENMITVNPQLRGVTLPGAVMRQRLDSLAARLSQLPGVDGVTMVESPPMGKQVPVESSPGLPLVYRNAVAPSYFHVMKLGVVRGRGFRPGEENVVVVSESAARTVWPNQDPLGKVWKLQSADRVVTGVVKDSGTNLLADPGSIEAYIPLESVATGREMLLIHTRGDPAQLVRTIAGAEVSSGEVLAPTLLRTWRDRFMEGQERMIKLIGSIGMVATALAAAGMFALVAFAVAQRRREFGIRIAIGARPQDILRVLMSQNTASLAGGIIAGTILAIILSRLVRNIVVLNQNGAIDVSGFALGIAGFLAVAILAVLSPAVRALRIDPSDTLREE